MVRAAQVEIPMRIVVEQPVPGVLYSLQSKDGQPFDARLSEAGETLTFDFSVRVGAGPKFFGDQVRREGPERRFVYIRVGQLAGDPSSPWTRRIKVDIHDIDQNLLDQAIASKATIETTIIGTGKDGTPTCAADRTAYRVMAE